MAGKTFKNTAGEIVDIPFKMKAVVQAGMGPATSWPKTLRFEAAFDVPLLDKEPGHVLIMVKAAAITSFDVDTAEGENGISSVGAVAGSACAGIVVALGEGCKYTAINDEVYCSCLGGAGTKDAPEAVASSARAALSCFRMLARMLTRSCTSRAVPVQRY